ncbi:FecR family protein [Sphingobacterium pedocola]|nr:FecR family protein [Sphingobacterium pedocola]
MDKKTFLEILAKYRSGKATSEEQHFLDVYYRLFEKDEDVLKQLTEKDRTMLKNRIKQGIDKHRTKKIPARKMVPSWYYAAAVALVVGCALWFYMPNAVEQYPTITQRDSIVPGGNSATLTLEDGKEIALSDIHDGIVVGDSIKYEDGQLVSSVKEGQMLTLQTPRGGQYQITLPDGTRVWLNAASSLRYPAQFGNKERRVYLEGEAYFDVTKMVLPDVKGTGANVPFLVQSHGQTVEVLGTQFNISAYSDDKATRTTLVEGQVNVALSNTGSTNDDVSRSLRPGQQSLLQNNGLQVNNVNVRQFTAWKEGKFVFEEEPLENILKTLARWYDVEIVYQGDRSYGTFTGSVGRYEHISGILDKIGFTQAVKFEIVGRRVIVM